MVDHEGKCSTCNALLWIAEEKLVCPKCSNWLDVTAKKKNELKKKIPFMLRKMGDIGKKVSYHELYPKVISQLENTSKYFLNMKTNLEKNIDILEQWIGYSIIAGLLVKKPKKRFFSNINLFELSNEIDLFFDALEKFRRSFVLLVKLENEAIHVFQNNSQEIMAIPPTKPILKTPASVTDKQHQLFDFFVNIEDERNYQSHYSMIDINYFPTQSYSLMGTYLSHSLGLPKYIVTRSKDKAMQLVQICSKLFPKFARIPHYDSLAFKERDFVDIFGKKLLKQLEPFFNKGGFLYIDTVQWCPSIFLRDLHHKDNAIIPLFYSNQILHIIISIKLGIKDKGSIGDLKGDSFEDEIFGYCETLNVTGEYKGEKLVRVPYPEIDSRMKELADIIFIGNKTGIIYVLSVKSQTVLTLKSQLKKLAKYFREQNLILDGLKIMQLNSRTVEWLFITPITCLPSYKNIKIFNIIQMIQYLSNKEGFTEIKLHTQAENLEVEDFERYGEFKLEGRRFCREICKIKDIRENTMDILIHKPQVYFSPFRLDIPEFCSITNLKKGDWINVLFEFRTKYSTQLVTFHSAEKISEKEAHKRLRLRGVHPPYP